MLTGLSPYNILYSSAGKMYAAGISTLDSTMNLVIIDPYDTPVTQTESFMSYTLKS